MRPRLIATLFVPMVGLLTATALVAAPGAKKKDEPPGPISDEQLQRTVENLKQVGLAWHNYEATYGHFPSNETDKQGKALLSWRVQLLPYIEEQDLFTEFRLDEPWDSEHNKKLIEKMPKLYAPLRGKADPGMTYYQSFTGQNAILKPGQKVTFAAITDGTSNTLMVAEAAKPVVWTRPDDLVFDGKDVPALGGVFDGKFHAVYCDGTVRRFRKGVDADILKRLIDPQDGQVLPEDIGTDADDKK